MKRRVLYVFLALVAIFVLYRFGRKPVIDWYAANYYTRTTSFPSSPMPDEICLTWSDDPQTTQTVQWRTAPSMKDGWIQYREKDKDAAAVVETQAGESVIKDKLAINDPVNVHHSAALKGLSPHTAYTYRVGSKSTNSWSDWADFTTAPDSTAPFSFIYMGDPQIGLDYWGKLLHGAYQAYPGAAFYVVAGDNVDNGLFRDQWDSYFAAGCSVFSHRALVPSLGNHDYAKGTIPRMYLDVFTLPTNGPKDFPPEQAYSFRYSNALFLVLDSNQPPSTQSAWMEDQLAHTDATWKFAVYHHPAYSSKPSRDNINPEIREQWGALFDKYHLDIALQGHDHAYLRTYPMHAGQRVDSPKDGTIYIVSVSGTKYYDQAPHDYTVKGFEKVSTYQVIDIGTNPDKLTYRAYDIDGNVRDEFTIEK